MSSRSLWKARLEAEMEHHLETQIDGLRITNPALFIKTILKTDRRTVSRYQFSREEEYLLAKEIMFREGLTEDEFIKKFYSPEEITHALPSLALATGRTEEELRKSIGLKGQAKPAPTGRELFLTSIEQLQRENPSWKPIQFLRFAESRIKKHFERSPKPFTEQDVAVGVKWFANTRKILKAEQDVKDRRSRSRTRVPDKKWRELFQLRFGRSDPPFARDYQKAVRAKASENAKRDKDPKATK